MEGMPFIGGVAWLLMIGGAVLLLVGLSFFLSWRFTKYQVTDQHVNVNSGVVFRRQRQARIDRYRPSTSSSPCWRVSSAWPSSSSRSPMRDRPP